jgi:antitoxin PrlF
MPSAALTSKGQITLPKEVREHLHLTRGDRVDFVVHEGGRVELRRAGTALEHVRGMLHRPGARPVSIEEMDAAIADAHSEP